MQGTIDESCEAVDGGNVFAGTCVVDIGREAVGGEVDNIVDAGAQVTDMGRKARIGCGSGVVDSWWRLGVELGE